MHTKLMLTWDVLREENRRTFLLKHSHTTMSGYYFFFKPLRWNVIFFLYGWPDTVSQYASVQLHFGEENTDLTKRV